jgi:hypothetical protein
MNENDLLIKSATLIGMAGVIAVPAGAAIEVIRKRVSIDGWPVLLLVMLTCLALTGLIAQPATITAAIDAVAVSVLAAIMASGGDAWARKLAATAKQTVVVDSSLKE